MFKIQKRKTIMEDYAPILLGLSTKQRQDLRRVATENGITVTSLIRQTIKHGLSGHVNPELWPNDYGQAE